MFQKTVVKMNGMMLVGSAEHELGKLMPTLSRDYELLRFSSGNEALAALAKQNRVNSEKIALIICEQNMQGMTGAEFLKRSISLLPRAKRVLLIDFPQLHMDAIHQAQLFRFITKPYTMERILSTIRMALKEAEEEQQPFICDHGIVGQSPRFLEVLRLVHRFSNSRAPVLVRGETGTGKELIARALHCNGPGKGKPYVVVNCSALPETLFEAEMFGHKKGAFTDAHQDRKGLVPHAEGGTLFIDEVGNIPLQVQTKLLRFLQFGEFQPVGSDRIETANVRVATATNGNLEKKIKDGSFRKDLYYRLKVLEVVLPPLRERPGDIRFLAEAFIKKYWTHPETPILTDNALKVLETYGFPGNVRELENVMQRACLVARTEEIDLDALPPELIRKVREKENREPAVAPPEPAMFPRLDKEALQKARIKAYARAGNQVEREFLIQLIARFDSITNAAAHAGMQRTYLHRLLTKHGF